MLVVTVYAGARGDAPSLSGDNLRVLASSGLALVIYAVIGVGIGALLRNQVGAIVGSLVYLFVVETVIRQIPATSGAYKWMPGGAARGADRDLRRGPICSNPGRAACCCSVTVWWPPWSAPSSPSGATSSDRPALPSQRPESGDPRVTTRMTAQRLGRLVAAGDADAVRTAVADSPGLLARTVERDGQGGWTPLHLAVAEGQEEIVRLLVDAGADLTARTDFNRTPLHVALQLRPEMVPVLREIGAQVDAPSAAYLGDVDELTRCLDDGTDPGRPGGRGRPPVLGRLRGCRPHGGTAPGAGSRPRHRRAALRRGRCAPGAGAAPAEGRRGREPARPRAPGAPRCTRRSAPGRAARHPRSSGCCSLPGPT